MAEQTSTGYFQNVYKFNGKELDAETGLYYYGARYYDPRGSWWLSVDPMADQFSSITPYMYCHGNPISRIDPNGMLDELVITGSEADKAVAQMQSASTITIKLARDPNTGKVKAIGEAMTEDDFKLLSVIDSKNIMVNIITANSSSIKFNGQKYETLGGAFLGNTVTTNAVSIELQTGIKPFETISITSDITKVKAYQFANPNLLENFDIFAGTSGKAMLHEVTESYSGALISMKTGISAKPASNINNSTYWMYEKAHNAKTTVPQPGDGVVTQDDLIRINMLKKK